MDEEKHNCPRCGYETIVLCNFIKHLERKNICKPNISDISLEEIKLRYTKAKVVTHICEDCDTSFFSKSSYYAHKKLCNKEETIQKLKKEIATLKASAVSTPSTSSSTTINNNNNTINNIINIQINGFGKEDMTYITNNKNYTGFMSSCIEKKIEGICNFMINKHFGKNNPENHNLKKLNKKDKFIDAFDGNKWKPRIIEDVLDDVFSYMEKDFQNFLNSEQNDKDRLRKNIIDTFMRSVGEPLNWDLDHGNYSYNEETPENKKEAMKKKIYILACEYIYRKSKEL
jgi:hypothetical protein